MAVVTYSNSRRNVCIHTTPTSVEYICIQCASPRSDMPLKRKCCYLTKFSSQALEVFSLTTSIDCSRLWKSRRNGIFRFSGDQHYAPNIYYLLHLLCMRFISVQVPFQCDIFILSCFFHMHVCIFWIRMLSFDHSKREVSAVSLLYIYSRWPLEMSNVGPNLRAVRASWHNSIHPFVGYDGMFLQN